MEIVYRIKKKIYILFLNHTKMLRERERERERERVIKISMTFFYINYVNLKQNIFSFFFIEKQGSIVGIHPI